MADNKDKKILNVPALRFPEFSGEWEKLRLSDFATKITKKNKGNIVKNVLCNSANLGLVPQGNYFDREIANTENTDGYYVICNGDFVYNPRKSTAAPFGPVNIYEGEDAGIISPLYLCFSVHNIFPKFLYYRFKSSAWHSYVYSHGDSGVRFDRVSIKDDVFFDMPIYKPAQDEQIKIATLLQLIDDRISTQNKIIEKLETLIKGIRHKVFKQLRKDFGFNSTIGDILSFEQPQRYIVSSAEYSNDGTFIPVLTANKAFILGYTTETDGIYDKGDCIIIDDFTLDCKYVSFPFKVKSSAIKILTANNKFILRYTYEYLKSLELSTEEHKRHYITEIQPYSCVLPDENTLKTIALVFENLAYKLANEQSLALILNKQRQYLLSKMFI